LVQDRVDACKGLLAFVRQDRFRVPESSPAKERIRKEWSRLNPRALREILEIHGYSDPEAAEVLYGAPLLGCMSGPSEWPEREPGFCLSREEVFAANVRDREQLLASIRPSRHDRQLKDASEADVKLGRMVGPFYSVDELPFPQCAISRRFAVVQNGTVRPCDDLTAGHQNAGTTSRRKLVLPTLDSFCALVAELWSACRALAGAPRAGPEYLGESRGATSRLGERAADESRGPPSGLHVWKRDQEAAFRQVPLREEDHCLAVVAFWDPDRQRTVLYYHRVLPFGAVSSVYSYNRISFALCFLARKMFFIPAQCYFDDTWGVEGADTAQSAFEAFGVLNTAFGFSMKVAKDVRPCKCAPILGVEADISRASVLLGITESREQKLQSIISSALSGGRLSRAEAASLGGKLGFACTAVFGRLGRAAVKPIREHGRVGGGTAPSPGLRRALQWFSAVLPTLPPRQVQVDQASSRPVSVLYTDGAGDGWISAVLFRGARVLDPQFASLKLSEQLLGALQPRRNQIGPIEALAVVLGLQAFKDELAGHDVLLFIDNTDAQGVLSKGFGRKVDVCLIAGTVWALAARSDIALHVERVRSALNIADGPSRPDEPGKMDELLSMGATPVAPPAFPDPFLRALRSGDVVFGVGDGAGPQRESQVAATNRPQ